MADRRMPVEVREALRVLGLRGPVHGAEVKRAYRRLVREQHPDAGGDAEAFHAIQTAYEVLRSGTDTRTGPAPQERTAAVDDRWWDTPSRWNEESVDLTGWDLHSPTSPVDGAAPDAELVARLVLAGPDAPTLASRGPSSRLGRLARMLDLDLLCRIEHGPASSGPRAGHDVVLRLMAPTGKGRRTAQQADLPAGWTRTRGADVVQLERVLRPSRDPRATAVRAALAIQDLTERLEWPLNEWFLVDSGP